MSRPIVRSCALVVAVVLAAVGVLGVACGSDRTAVAPAPGTGAAAADGCVEAPYATIAVAELPGEARRVLALIDAGGPYPYQEDDSVFQNREGLLPTHARGYYREYTVPTPGEDDRGPRRIVAGECGERFYTADHYASFALVEGDG